ncbi:putative G-protein coupled receptor 25 [Mixophyes fleayi]|uniref:putative G-protein coupled receptor 25 n=1 Tax=Mixophyes fleayi TaxID=3061075 RepID=UPI003F4E3692
MDTESWTFDYYSLDSENATEEPWTFDYFPLDYENGTCQFEELPHARWLLPTLYSVFFLIGLTGNVVVIAVVFKRSSRRADTFILNLAVSDLLFVMTLPLWASALAQGGQWPFGVYLCKASGFAIAVTRCASSLLMAIMSVDRYFAVIKGTKVHPLRIRSCSVGACCTIWALSILVGFPSLVSRHVDSEKFTCVDSGTSTFSLGFKMAVILLTFVLPFAVVLFCYCRMAKYLWNYFGSYVGTSLTSGKPRRGHRWLRIVSCVVGAYCFSWLPFNTLSTVSVISKLGADIPCPAWLAIHQAMTATAALAFANSCANPLIYALLDAGFRRRAQSALPGLFRTCRSILPITGWSVPTNSATLESTSTYTGNR